MCEDAHPHTRPEQCSREGHAERIRERRLCAKKNAGRLPALNWQFVNYCCAGGLAGAGWSAGRATTCGILRVFNVAPFRFRNLNAGMVEQQSNGPVQFDFSFFIRCLRRNQRDLGRCHGCLICRTRVEVEAPRAYFFCSASRDWRAKSTAAWADATLARFCCTPDCACATSIRIWFSSCCMRSCDCRYSNSPRT